MANYEFHNNNDGTYVCQNCGKNTSWDNESRLSTGAEVLTICPECYDENNFEYSAKLAEHIKSKLNSVLNTPEWEGLIRKLQIAITDDYKWSFDQNVWTIKNCLDK